MSSENRAKTGPNPCHGLVLVADGAEDVRSTATAILGPAGFDVIQSADGQEAFAAIRDRVVEVVVLGDCLAGMSAREIVRAATAQGLKVPIILWTSVRDPARTAEALKEGAWDCLDRPSTARELLAAVFSALRHAQPGRPRGREDWLWDIAQRSQKMETAGLLAGSVVHDLNNLLTVALGYADMLQLSQAPGSSSWMALEEIRRAVTGGAALARELLTLGRREPYQPQLLNLNTILKRMGGLLRQVAGEQIEVPLRLEPGLGLIQADPGQIDQVIMNLVLNARDAIQAKAESALPGQLVLQTTNLDLVAPSAEHPGLAPGSYIVLQVSDTGCGMSPETRARLFEPFYTTKRPGKGTGLGLATIHEILRRLGGQITVQSQLGVGTTFALYFPHAGHSCLTVERPRCEPVSRPGTGTILVVEDHQEVRDLLRRALQNNGYQVLEAARAEEALAIGRQAADSIQMLISDLVLPDGSGVQVARLIQALRPEIQVLFLTGYSAIPVLPPGEDFAGAKVLCKPFRPSDLVAEVNHCLNRDNSQTIPDCGEEQTSPPPPAGLPHWS